MVDVAGTQVLQFRGLIDEEINAGFISALD